MENMLLLNAFRNRQLYFTITKAFTALLCQLYAMQNTTLFYLIQISMAAITTAES